MGRGLIVRGFRGDDDPEKLREMFAPFGTVLKANISPGGLGFVDFDDDTCNARAIESLNNTEFQGAVLSVQEKGECFECGSYDHIAKNCPKRRQQGGYGGGPGGGGGGGGGRQCYNCGGFGHFARDCTEPRQEGGGRGGPMRDREGGRPGPRSSGPYSRPPREGYGDRDRYGDRRQDRYGGGRSEGYDSYGHSRNGGGDDYYDRNGGGAPRDYPSSSYPDRGQSRYGGGRDYGGPAPADGYGGGRGPQSSYHGSGEADPSYSRGEGRDRDGPRQSYNPRYGDRPSRDYYPDAGDQRSRPPPGGAGGRDGYQSRDYQGRGYGGDAPPAEYGRDRQNFGGPPRDGYAPRGRDGDRERRDSGGYGSGGYGGGGRGAGRSDYEHRGGPPRDGGDEPPSRR